MPAALDRVPAPVDPADEAPNVLLVLRERRGLQRVGAAERVIGERA